MRSISPSASSRKVVRNSSSARRSGRSWMKVRTETSGLRISCATPAASVPSADEAIGAGEELAACRRRPTCARMRPTSAGRTLGEPLGERARPPASSGAPPRRASRRSADRRVLATRSASVRLHGPSSGGCPPRRGRETDAAVRGHRDERAAGRLLDQERGALEARARARAASAGRRRSARRSRGSLRRAAPPPSPHPAHPPPRPSPHRRPAHRAGVQICSLVDARRSGSQCKAASSARGCSARGRRRRTPTASSAKPSAERSCPAVSSSW